MNTCRAVSCEQKENHVLSAHQCTKCKRFGHDDPICGNLEQITVLKLAAVNDKLPLTEHCIIANCRYPWSHTTTAHACGSCGNPKHSYQDCKLTKLLANPHNAVLRQMASNPQLRRQMATKFANNPDTEE